jgi:hypothetical protein
MTMPAQRGITITPEFSSPYADGISTVFRLRVTASRAYLLPREVFAYRAIPLQPGQAAPTAIFSHICSPSDLDDFPVGAPYDGAVPPWFRLDFCDLQFRNRRDGLSALAQVEADVQRLIEALDAADLLVPGTPVRLGAPFPDDVGSGSSDGSLNE